MTTWVFEVPIRVDAHANQRRHHYAASRAKQKERNAMVMAWTVARSVHKFTAPSYPVEVLFTRIGPGVMDDDNVPNACKYLRDELCRCWGLIRGDGKPKFTKRGRPILPQAKDDGDEVVWKYDQEKGPRGHYAVRVTITHLAP